MLKWRRHMTWLALVIAVGTTIVPLRGTAEAVPIRHYDPWDSPRIGDPDDGGTIATGKDQLELGAYWITNPFYGALAIWTQWILRQSSHANADKLNDY